jgi:2-haloacid dehalogenase
VTDRTTAVGAVVLDIGNVLIEWNPERLYDAVLGEAGRRALFAAVDLHGMNARVDGGADWHGEVEALACAHPGHAGAIRLWRDRWIEMASPMIPGSVALLRALKAAGVPVWALTNFGRETFEQARRHYPFLDLFDGAVVSGRVGLMKPNPAIYAALECAAGLSGAALLFVDDREENVEAAAARGWRTHLFRGAEGLAARLRAEGFLAGEVAA